MIFRLSFYSASHRRTVASGGLAEGIPWPRCATVRGSSNHADRAVLEGAHGCVGAINDKHIKKLIHLTLRGYSDARGNNPRVTFSLLGYSDAQREYRR